MPTELGMKLLVTFGKYGQTFVDAVEALWAEWCILKSTNTICFAGILDKPMMTTLQFNQIALLLLVLAISVAPQHLLQVDVPNCQSINLRF